MKSEKRFSFINSKRENIMEENSTESFFDFSLNRSIEELLMSFWDGVNAGEILNSNEIAEMDTLENYLADMGIL